MEQRSMSFTVDAHEPAARVTLPPEAHPQHLTWPPWRSSAQLKKWPTAKAAASAPGPRSTAVMLLSLVPYMPRRCVFPAPSWPSLFDLRSAVVWHGNRMLKVHNAQSHLVQGSAWLTKDGTSLHAPHLLHVADPGSERGQSLKQLGSMPLPCQSPAGPRTHAPPTLDHASRLQQRTRVLLPGRQRRRRQPRAHVHGGQPCAHLPWLPASLASVQPAELALAVVPAPMQCQQNSY